MGKLSDHIFDNLEHGRGKRLPVRKKERVVVASGADRHREKRHQHKPFPYLTLAAALKKALATPALKRRFSVLDIAGEWENLVGESMALHVQPFSLEKGVLVLQTDSSVWRHQVSLLRPEILSKLQAHLGVELVKQVRVK
jgi:predicted nucleic acid-binding Zn ribbon protein